MKKFMKLIEKYFVPVSTILSTNRYLIALRDGLMLAMPLLIIGSVCIIIADFPIPAFQEFMVGVFGDSWYSWCWDIAFPATIGLVTLFAIFGVSYSLAREYNCEPLPSAALAVTAYFILLHQLDGGGFSAGDFEAKGLFTGMITALISAEIYCRIIKANLVIKMPSSVPPSISRSFAALVPAAVIIPLFLLIRLAFSLTPYVTVNEFIIQVIQAPLTNIGTSLVGTLTASFFNSFLWLFGIHGTAVIGSIMDPLWYAARFENLAAYKAGLSLPYIVTMDYANFFIFLGGTGLTLPLAFLMTFVCKSKRIKSLGKLSIFPGLFNINEPIIFGLPIVLNPIMIIPFFLAPTVSVLISYLAMDWGWVAKPTGVTIPWTTPAPIGGYLMTNSWTGGALQIVVLLIAGIIYYPFIKMLDNKYLSEESQHTDHRENITSNNVNISALEN